MNETSRWHPEAYVSKFNGLSHTLTDGSALLDSAASSLRLECAARAQFEYESSAVGNPNRGAHAMASYSSAMLDRSREQIAACLGLPSECVSLTSGATESSNMLALSARVNLASSDTVYVSAMEHHSSYLPWVEACGSTGARFVEMPVGQDSSLDLAWFEENVALDKPKWVVVSGMGNVSGSRPDIERISKMAKLANADSMVAVDCAQLAAHARFDTLKNGADWLYFSGHKIHAPSGIGVLAASNPLLFDAVSPGKIGGGMIRGFRSNGAPRYAQGHLRFEAGSPNVGGALGLAESMREQSSWDREALFAHEERLCAMLVRGLSDIGGISIVGQDKAGRHGLVSWVAEWAHAHDIGTILDAHKVYARVGHHCALPLMRSLGISSCVRFSFTTTSTERDVHQALEAVSDAARRFKWTKK